MSANPGKLVHERRIVDLDRMLGGDPHHQRRHRDPVVHVGRDEPAAGHTSFAVDDQK